ncbi:BlaR1 peptidase M56 [Salegentibacter sp. 24]|uniref:M56 family metallopeptidase n=1 Tax=Salegentibacter sp. 24 TaxID=2183986 RepID=UPI00105D1CAA|nr:M56 family metallopeptidase [Salegentibacter sp. 24]TDN89116.1 BlaR1 peptidase M56 [Salegentibacter sp. 24]
MEWYILKSIAVMAVLLLFYKLLLEKVHMHWFKRFYLLFALVASVGIPLITITTYVEPVSRNFDPLQFQFSEEISAAEDRSFEDYFPTILWTIYILGVILFSIKFFKNLKKLWLKIKINQKIKKGNFTRILLQEKIDPHTFLNYIFLNKKKYENKQIPREVILHEESHAKQKHSLDILFVEFIQIIFWMNPVIILLKDAIKLNHEFLADFEVLRKGIQTAEYQYTLLSFSSGHLHNELVNPINYSSIKKRFTVMKTQTSKSTIWARSLLILPLLSFLFFSFSNKEIVERDTSILTTVAPKSNTLMLKVNENGKVFFQKDQIQISELQNLIKKRAYSSYHIEVHENSSPSNVKNLIQFMADNKLDGNVSNYSTTKKYQEKVTPEMVEEYNKLVKELNETGIIKQKDLNRIQKIFRAMTQEQKKNAAQPKYIIVPELIEEYNRMAKYYNSMPENATFIKVKDYNRMKYIYDLLPEKQRRNVEKFPIASPPPPPAPAPAAPPAPPAPPTFEKLLEDNATFYYQGQSIEPQKARELVEEQKKVDVEITYDNQERPIVKLTDKKEL